MAIGMGAPRADKERPRATRPRTPLLNRLVLRLLGSRLRPLLDQAVGILRYTTRTGAVAVLPVMVVRDGGRVVILVGHPEKKHWWRHFTKPAPVDVWLDGQWLSGIGITVTGQDNPAASVYRRAYPRVRFAEDGRFVLITFAEPLPPHAALRGRPLLWTWFWVVTLAELIGFTVPVCVGALTADSSSAVILTSLLVAGAIEGSMLGWGQAVVLRHAIPGIPRRRWIVATAAGAAVAYLIGLGPTTYAGSITAWPLALVIAVVAVLGAALLASIGTAQWLVLRHHVDDAARWIVATAAAWTAGLGVFLAFATPLWQPGQPLALILLIGVVGGLLMAATAAAITGYALHRLLPEV